MHPSLLPNAETEGVISKQNIEVLKRAIESTNVHEHKMGVKSKSIPSFAKTVSKQRNVLDDNKYGPGNEPHWALNRTRFPNLIRALNMELNMNIRKKGIVTISLVSGVKNVHMGIGHQ